MMDMDSPNWLRGANLFGYIYRVDIQQEQIRKYVHNDNNRRGLGIACVLQLEMSHHDDGCSASGITLLIHSFKSFNSFSLDECPIPLYALNVRPLIPSGDVEGVIPRDEVKKSDESLEI